MGAVMQQPPLSDAKGRLAIVAGKGDLPARIAEACSRQNRDYVMIGIEDNTPPETVEQHPHFWIKLGALGKAFEIMRGNDVGSLVMAGRIERPSITTLRPDATTARLLAKLGTKLFAGDDRLLSTIIKFMEEEGFSVVGIDDVLDDVLMPEGLITKVFPNKQSQADIEIGVAMAKEIGRLDIGQAVVVQQGHVLGVEAMEGTDNLIARCGALKTAERGGVLVKVKKPHQERRVDLPTIGVETVRRVAEAGLLGIAIEAGGSLIVDRKAVEREANEHNVFVVGFTV
jgi:DUF1009 family protein